MNKRFEKMVLAANDIGGATEMDALRALATSIACRAYVIAGGHPQNTTDILLDVCGQALKVTIDAGEGPSALHRPLAVIQ